MRRFREVAAVAVLLALSGVLFADCRARVVVEKVVVEKKVVVQEVSPVLAVYLPLYVAPGYPGPAAAYPPQAASAQQQATVPAADPNAALLAELRKMNARLDALERRAAPGQPPDVPPRAPPGQPMERVPEQQGAADPGLQVLRAKCAACHAQGNEAKGRGFVLLDAAGNLASITDRSAVKALAKMQYNEMPPPGNAAGVAPLTDQEYAEASKTVQRAVLARK